MFSTHRPGIGAALLALVAVAGLPLAEAGHGGWWRADNTPTTHPMFPNPGSKATSSTGEVFDLVFHWGGGGGSAGLATIEMFDPASGELVHTSTFAAVEDVTSVTWVPCPFPNSSGTLLLTVPNYSVIAPGILSLGAGAPGGSGIFRESYCNDSTVPDFGNPVINDPLYFKAFSDYEGEYITTVGTPAQLTLFHLELHVRGFEHG